MTSALRDNTLLLAKPHVDRKFALWWRSIKVCKPKFLDFDTCTLLSPTILGPNCVFAYTVYTIYQTFHDFFRLFVKTWHLTARQVT
jgi:hypothetical protein